MCGSNIYLFLLLSSVGVALPSEHNLWPLHDRTWQFHVEKRTGYSLLLRHKGDFKIALKIQLN